MFKADRIPDVVEKEIDNADDMMDCIEEAMYNLLTGEDQIISFPKMNAVYFVTVTEEIDGTPRNIWVDISNNFGGVNGQQ